MKRERAIMVVIRRRTAKTRSKTARANCSRVGHAGTSSRGGGGGRPAAAVRAKFGKFVEPCACTRSVRVRGELHAFKTATASRRDHCVCAQVGGHTGPGFYARRGGFVNAGTQILMPSSVIIVRFTLNRSSGMGLQHATTAKRFCTPGQSLAE